MKTKEILKYNDRNFLTDLKSVRTLVVMTKDTGTIFEIRKKELIKTAENRQIYYQISTNIFQNKRKVMVVY